jgi:hypothetical protein
MEAKERGRFHKTLELIALKTCVADEYEVAGTGRSFGSRLDSAADTEV